MCSVNPRSDTSMEQEKVTFDWGVDKIFGVNIGGWLVLEPFITPSIFEKHNSDDWPVYDEWTLCEKLGQNKCADALKPHWENFVSYDDFKRIKDAGFNVVRIAVGYWSFVEPWGPYTQGAAPYLDRAIDWARQTNLKVVIDLHGAPKSQNGFDHSGRKAEVPGWGDPDSVKYTLATLEVIEKKYATPDMQDVIVAIEFLNEPWLKKLDMGTVKQFYRDAFYNLRQISNTSAMIHDGFYDPRWLNGFLTPQDNDAQGVIVDHHEYQIFGSGTSGMSVDQHVALVCNSVGNYDGSDKWTVVGEWSGAMTDCAPHLNGFNAGSRMEGTFEDSSFVASCAGKSGPISTWSQQWKDDVRRYIEVQLDAYTTMTRGYFFWNFKTEGHAGEWDLFELLDNEVFPQPPRSRRFGKACGNF
ncbi:glucan 13-beta-glucosidase precursor [Pyrenophora seminiperda CCB06]|uniref:Glucan 13-beta-glucosidase n=1 Tax=Pyrenophora seminiperda CCB06 TaxID=1302712 RepID=A0A3M7MH01_9PLEO|nr:glucan 13-beta-glucosidase precursor [Pyrenophora seminiperda CCB06]